LRWSGGCFALLATDGGGVFILGFFCGGVFMFIMLAMFMAGRREP
jgi:hypothetical protein